MPTLLIVSVAVAFGDTGAASAGATTEITRDTTLDPGKTYGAIVIKASNVTIDGRGAAIIGARDGNPKDFKGIGISAAGVSKTAWHWSSALETRRHGLGRRALGTWLTSKRWKKNHPRP